MNIFSPVKLGALTLPNRIVMAPMTRLRAVDSIPNSLMGIYYGQRASAGLIVTECTMVSPLSNGYINCPGIYSPEQVEGWRQVVEEVHAKNGRIFLQLWHCGRVSHPSLLNGVTPVAPSTLAATGTLHTPVGKVNLETPRALETQEISEIVEQFRQGAENAKQAGFDGVELHGAFGYLIDQFLQDGSNRRSDQYGGSLENRARFLLEIIEAVSSVMGSDRVGLKLSPSNTLYGVHDLNPKITFGYVIEQLNRFNLAYLHLMEPSEIDLANREVLNPVLPIFRPLYQGLIITNGGYDKSKANKVLAMSEADVVSFARLFIANPDLPKRFATDATLNEANPKTIYGRGDKDLDKGYIDYPFH